MSIFTIMIIGGIGLLLIVFLVSFIFQTPWKEWNKDQNKIMKKRKK